MTRRSSESGFTLLEVLVASMLLAMLITILTMVFNSSSIAWSMGKAGVAEMDAIRNNVSAANVVADNAVPRVDLQNPDVWGHLVSPWKANGDLRRRAIEKMTDNQLASRSWSMLQMDSSIKSPVGDSGPGQWARATGRSLWASFAPGSISISGNAKAFIVGVWSLGPDGKENSGDDISTWPDID